MGAISRFFFTPDMPIPPACIPPYVNFSFLPSHFSGHSSSLSLPTPPPQARFLIQILRSQLSKSMNVSV